MCHVIVNAVNKQVNCFFLVRELVSNKIESVVSGYQILYVFCNMYFVPGVDSCRKLLVTFFSSEL